MTANPGDWVRFYHAGRMTIAVVQFVRTKKHYPWGHEALTDIAPVAFDDILEVRSVAALADDRKDE